MNFLTEEEIETLQNSPICLSCGHRGVFHDEEDFICILLECGCEQFIQEEDYSPWSIKRYENRHLYTAPEFKALEDKLLELASMNRVSELFDTGDKPTKAKTIQVVRYPRLK